MQRWLRSAPHAPSLRVFLLKHGIRQAHALPVACSLRQLHSQPSGLPPPIGLVDFMGFDGKEHNMNEPPSDYDEEKAEKWRDRVAGNLADEKQNMQHPIFQPLIRIVNEVPKLQLAGALLESVNRDARQGPKIEPEIVGDRRLMFGSLDYVDKLSGDRLRYVEFDVDQVTITLDSMSFIVLLKEAVFEDRECFGYQGRSVGMRRLLVQNDEEEHEDATEDELDQVVCTSPYLKLRSTRDFSAYGARHSGPSGKQLVLITLSFCHVIGLSRAMSSSRLAGIYRAPRDGTFWLRDFWSAVEDYERRLLLFNGVDGVNGYVFVDNIRLLGDEIILNWSR